MTATATAEYVVACDRCRLNGERPFTAQQAQQLADDHDWWHHPGGKSVAHIAPAS
jgi:hypothetical protein